jgi:PIN domain nuclease of toxin-antitoxin system
MIDFLRAAEDEALVLPIDSAVAERSMTFSPNFPKDPADRIIAATALVHGLTLVTADEAIRKSGEVSCIW